MRYAGISNGAVVLADKGNQLRHEQIVIAIAKAHPAGLRPFTLAAYVLILF